MQKHDFGIVIDPGATLKTEVQRIFLKSESGYSILILFRLTPTSVHSEKLQWDYFDSYIGQPKRDLLKNASLWPGKNPENRALWVSPYSHFTRMSFSEFLDWIDTGCANAVAVEELLAANPDVKCSAWLCETADYESCKNIDIDIKTTKDLDDWIQEYRKPKKRKGSRDYVDIISRSISFSGHKKLVLPS